jgi:hypothetical protein
MANSLSFNRYQRVWTIITFLFRLAIGILSTFVINVGLLIHGNNIIYSSAASTAVKILKDQFHPAAYPNQSLEKSYLSLLLIKFLNQDPSLIKLI